MYSLKFPYQKTKSRSFFEIFVKHSISFYNFINTIDPNDVGFISVNQLEIGINKVLTLSQPAKDGLFAYLDKQKIGLVDPKEFLKVLKRTVIDKNVVCFD